MIIGNNNIIIKIILKVIINIIVNISIFNVF